MFTFKKQNFLRTLFVVRCFCSEKNVIINVPWALNNFEFLMSKLRCLKVKHFIYIYLNYLQKDLPGLLTPDNQLQLYSIWIMRLSALPKGRKESSQLLCLGLWCSLSLERCSLLSVQILLILHGLGSVTAGTMSWLPVLASEKAFVTVINKFQNGRCSSQVVSGSLWPRDQISSLCTIAPCTFFLTELGELMCSSGQSTGPAARLPGLRLWLCHFLDV